MGMLWANLRVELPHLPSEPPDDDMDAYVEQHLCATGADVAACGTLKDALSKLRRVWDAIQALNLLNSSMRIPATVIYTQTVEFGEFEHIHSPQQLQDMLKKVKVGVFKTDAERNGVILASVCALFAHVNDARSELDVLKLLKFTDADLDDSAIVYHIYYSLKKADVSTGADPWRLVATTSPLQWRPAEMALGTTKVAPRSAMANDQTDPTKRCVSNRPRNQTLTRDRDRRNAAAVAHFHGGMARNLPPNQRAYFPHTHCTLLRHQHHP